MSSRDVVLSHPVRTAIGTFNGTLKATPATELGATVVRETLRRSGLDPARVGSVVMGNVIQAGNRMNAARQAAINGGVPVAVPAMTVNRVCGSGAQAIASAAQEIWLGHTDIAIAGGMENMDRAPYLLPSGRWGQRMGDAQIYDSMLRDGLNDAFSDEHSGWHTEDLVVRNRITREDQDRWAERSQKRFAAAQAAGRFTAEIVGVEVKGRKGPQIFDIDEANRPETTLEVLAKLKAALRMAIQLEPPGRCRRHVSCTRCSATDSSVGLRRCASEEGRASRSRSRCFDCDQHPTERHPMKIGRKDIMKLGLAQAHTLQENS